jgi:hypothetical protein
LRWVLSNIFAQPALELWSSKCQPSAQLGMTVPSYWLRWEGCTDFLAWLALNPNPPDLRSQPLK